MKFNFEIKTIETEKEVKQVIDFIRKYPMNYWNYPDWTEKVYYQLMKGKKQAIFNLSEKRITADLIFQSIGGGITELKNLRTHVLLQNRGIMNFMINQLEIELLKEKSKGILADTRKDNLPIINLLEKRGYKRVGEKNLYEKKFLDVIYYKELIPKIHLIKPNY